MDEICHLLVGGGDNDVSPLLEHFYAIVRTQFYANQMHTSDSVQGRINRRAYCEMVRAAAMIKWLSFRYPALKTRRTHRHTRLIDSASNASTNGFVDL